MLLDLARIPDHTHSNYPVRFQPQVAGRSKQRLGDAAGLKNFGVNLVRLTPGSCSALRHWHSRQDEFIYVLEGELMLKTNAGKACLTPGMAAGFPAGEADGHHLCNESGADAVYLEIGDRTPDDQVEYPDDDLMAKWVEVHWQFTHKDGTPYGDPNR
ncbi:cupin domain-containing protein [Acaryochloris sp. IP29b_bin.137]|uniref:cupin domain-containing protein n=1 Tax=Acaryochloris sp. IP29b_bin.137 TaxID=2969217 RepID=UPI0026299EEF|nr:cupin domain-containing protein [Acaryochloris sp. IP29b_bin.137]